MEIAAIEKRGSGWIGAVPGYLKKRFVCKRT